MTMQDLDRPAGVSPKHLDPDTAIVDTDVHEYLRSANDLLPYLASEWRRHITDYGWNKIMLPSDTPYVAEVPGVGATRKDWVLEDGTRANSLSVLQNQLFDGEGVSIAILNGFFYPAATKANYEFIAALGRAYNDWQIDNWLNKDSRLRGSIHIGVDDVDGAVAEIERLADHPQIVQVFLPTVTDREWGDPRYHKIYEAAYSNDLVIAFHHCQNTRTLLGLPRNFIEWHTMAAPGATMNQIISMIFNGVFDKLPNLKAVFLEAGVGWVPYLMWRADQQYRELRVNTPWVKKLPSEHMRNNIRLSTQPFSDVKTSHFVEMTAWTKSEAMYMFATDYPHYDADSADAVLPKSMPEELRRRIRYRNALETYPRLKGLVG